MEEVAVIAGAELRAADVKLNLSVVSARACPTFPVARKVKLNMTSVRSGGATRDEERLHQVKRGSYEVGIHAICRFVSTLAVRSFYFSSCHSMGIQTALAVPWTMPHERG